MSILEMHPVPWRLTRTRHVVAVVGANGVIIYRINMRRTGGARQLALWSSLCN